MIRTIQKWLARRAYWQKVEANLRILLLTMPEGKYRSILKSYPGARQASDDGWRRGQAAEEECVRIAASMLSDVILRGLTSSQRADVLRSLQHYGENSEVPPGDPNVVLWTNLILTVEGQAYAMAESGSIGSNWHDMLMSEIFGALRGLDRRERSSQRVMNALERAVFPPRDSGKM